MTDLSDPNYQAHLLVKCPKCGAVPDEECFEGMPGHGGMRQVKPHKERIKALAKTPHG